MNPFLPPTFNPILAPPPLSPREEGREPGADTPVGGCGREGGGRRGRGGGSQYASPGGAAAAVSETEPLVGEEPHRSSHSVCGQGGHGCHLRVRLVHEVVPLLRLEQSTVICVCVHVSTIKQPRQRQSPGLPGQFMCLKQQV